MLLNSGAPLSVAGSVSNARPVQPTPRTVSIVPADTSPGGLGRIALFYQLFTSGLSSTGKRYVTVWSSVEEDESNGDIVVDPVHGIGIATAGVYAVNLFVRGDGMINAAADCVVMGFCDYLAPFTESFGVVTRGGDPSVGLLLPSTSRTYFMPGGWDGTLGPPVLSLLQPGLAWDNLDVAHVTDIQFEVQVQKIV